MLQQIIRFSTQTSEARTAHQNLNEFSPDTDLSGMSVNLSGP